jgi:hypothetical protein
MIKLCTNMYKLINKTDNLFRISTWVQVVQGLSRTETTDILAHTELSFDYKEWDLLEENYYSVARFSQKRNITLREMEYTIYTDYNHDTNDIIVIIGKTNSHA